MFARDTFTNEDGETVHVVSQADLDGVDGEAGEGDLLIGQFGAYRTCLLGTPAPANAVIYNVG